MSSVLEAGFIFWGLFLVFFLIVVAYLFWMVRAERGTDETLPGPEGKDP